MRGSFIRNRVKGYVQWSPIPRAAMALAMATAGLLLAACSGGGGGTTAATTSAVSGSVFAAPVNGASVTVKYADNNATVAGPVTTAADGTYSVSIPNGALSEALRFESSGGTFTDEATGTPGVAAGRLAAYAEADSLRAGSAVHLTPASTIVSDLVAAGNTLAQANAAFSAAFGFTDNASVAPKNDNAAGTSDAQKLAALRAVAFSQLAEDMGPPLVPADQFGLISKLADDLSDGVLNGVQGGTALTVGSVPLREDIQNRFGNALARCWADTSCNKTGLAADKIGAPPFAKVAYTGTYRIEYIAGMMPAAMGKSQFKLRVTLHDNVTPASGGLTLFPYMHMATKSHSSPLDNAVVENPAGTYSCTVYYLMSTEMGGMSMGFWELNVTVNGETATFFPYVGMAMGTDTVRAILRGVNDNVNNTLEPKRRYFFFKDGEVTDDNTVHLFLAAYDSMDSWPSVAVGTTLHDALGAAYTVNDVLIQGSPDNVTYYDGAATGAHWTVTVPGLTGPIDNVYLRLRVNGEWKTTGGKSTDPDYIPFQVTP